MKEKYPEKFASEEKIFAKSIVGTEYLSAQGAASLSILSMPLSTMLKSTRRPSLMQRSSMSGRWGLRLTPMKRTRAIFAKTPSSSGTIRSGRRSTRALQIITPIFLSQVPRLFYRKMVPIDVALIQTSPPDHHGYMSLGVSVDITKAATENATLVIAQVNDHMPRVHGDTFIHIDSMLILLSPTTSLYWSMNHGCRMRWPKTSANTFRN